MPFIPFEEFDIDTRIEHLHKALKQLQARFEYHEHGRDGRAVVSLHDTVDLDGIYEAD